MIGLDPISLDPKEGLALTTFASGGLLTAIQQQFCTLVFACLLQNDRKVRPSESTLHTRRRGWAWAEAYFGKFRSLCGPPTRPCDWHARPH